jgi:feruloyl-CoA synthase
MVYWSAERAGLLGLPQPGMAAKLVPAGDRYELRVKGPNVAPGYYGDPQATVEAFDEEGFFRTGDAARWVDETRPEKGITFAGRVSEEFKLASGTWVRATTLRGQLITALQPYVRDLVIAAPDRPWLGALLWLDPAACTGDWKAVLKERLASFNAGPGGSSTRIRRLLPLDTPPSPADGEVTDKRSINTRRVLERRAADVARLYAEPIDTAVISA